MFPELRELRVRMDDWRGLASQAERKRRQNRLNQRAFRKRSRPQKSGQHYPTNDSSSTSSQPLPPPPPSPLLQSRALTRAVDAQSGHLLPPCVERSAAIQALRMQAYQSYALNAPRPSQLQFLIRLNVLDALAHNALALGFPIQGLCSDDFISPFAYLDPTTPRLMSEPSVETPASLAPTNLQRTVRHHPWIDLFPLPRLRDNILRALDAGLIDEDELCGDLLNVEDANWHDEDKPSLIVWGEPWDVCGWEATVAFLHKWAWLARGCPELIEATNHWRMKRGDKRIILDLNAEESGFDVSA